MMTPEMALQVLTLATANLQATRQQHNEIGAALQTLQGIVAASKLVASEPKKTEPKAK